MFLILGLEECGLFCYWRGYLTKWLLLATACYYCPVKVRKTFHQERLCIENFLLEHVDWYRISAVYGIFCTDWEKTGAHIDIICERDVWLSFCVVIQKNCTVLCIVPIIQLYCITLLCTQLVCKFRENKISYNYICMKFFFKSCLLCVCTGVQVYAIYVETI